MSGKKRLSIPGAIHYIFAKSINETLLFNNDNDRCTFLEMLQDNLNHTGFQCLKYELSDRYYKLVLKINNLPLCALFRRLNSLYALWYNKIHQREGHLFHRRFKSVVLDENFKSQIMAYLKAEQTTDGILFNHLYHQKTIKADAEETFFSILKNNSNPYSDGDFVKIIDNINSETQNRFDPRCWSIGSKSFISHVMAKLQDQYQVVANYTLTDWDLSKLRNFVLSRFDVQIEDFQFRGRLNKQSTARKLFAYFAVKKLNFPIAEVKKFLKVSGTAISNLARKGVFIAKELCIFLPSNPSNIPEPIF